MALENAWDQKPQFPTAVVPRMVPTTGYDRTDFPDEQAKTTKKHSHYFKDVSKLETIDVYRVLQLFTVTDPCIQHAVKKLLVAGGRGAGKDISKDVQEAIDSLLRYQAMATEDAKV